MYKHNNQTQEVKSQSTTQIIQKRQIEENGTFEFKDNRPESVAQLKLQEIADNSPHIQQLMQLQSMADQGHQGFASLMPPPFSIDTPIQKKENNTGLPDNLKSGIENLSGYSMDDVKVHYNSPKPAQLQAHAYAQGTDIHLGSGQEKHLAHEAWHVVQQKQGRVKPTMQMKGKVNVNDDKGLEHEADVMGARALNEQNQMPKGFPKTKNNVTKLLQKKSYTDKDLLTYLKNLGNHTVDFDILYAILDKWKIGNAKFILSTKQRKVIIDELMTKNNSKNAQYIQYMLESATKIEFLALTRTYGGGESLDIEKLKGIIGEKVYENIKQQQNIKKMPSADSAFPAEKVMKVRDALSKNAETWNRQDCVTVFDKTEIRGLFEDYPELMKTHKEEMKRLSRTPIRPSDPDGPSIFIITEVAKVLENEGIAEQEQKINYKNDQLIAGQGWDQIVNAASEEGWHFFALSLSKGSHTAAAWVDNRKGGPFVYFSDQYRVSSWDDSEQGSLGGFKQYTKANFNEKLNGYSLWGSSFWKIKSVPTAYLPQKQTEFDKLDKLETIEQGKEALEKQQKLETQQEKSKLDIEIEQLTKELSITPLYNETLIQKIEAIQSILKHIKITRKEEENYWHLETSAKYLTSPKEYSLPKMPKAPASILTMNSEGLNALYITSQTPIKGWSPTNSRIAGVDKLLTGNANNWSVIAALPYNLEQESPDLLIPNFILSDYKKVFQVSSERIYKINVSKQYFEDEQYEGILNELNVSLSEYYYTNEEWKSHPSKSVFHKKFTKDELGLYQQQKALKALTDIEMKQLGLSDLFITFYRSNKKHIKAKNLKKLKKYLRRTFKKNKLFDEIHFEEMLLLLDKAVALQLIQII